MMSSIWAMEIYKNCPSIYVKKFELKSVGQVDSLAHEIKGILNVMRFEHHAFRVSCNNINQEGRMNITSRFSDADSSSRLCPLQCNGCF